MLAMNQQLTHRKVWSAIDKLAESRCLTLHGLTVVAGISQSCLNKHTRVINGRERWPSTETLSMIMTATDCSLNEMFKLIKKAKP